MRLAYGLELAGETPTFERHFLEPAGRFFLVSCLSPVFNHVPPPRAQNLGSQRKKKADVVKHSEVFNHVGILVNGLLGTAEAPFI
ncbi:MAG TPA: hypothetical protein VGX70_09445 [Gemmataceae bacterium]|nr:hypothetical protein [Gemmataceae bacterium]